MTDEDSEQTFRERAKDKYGERIDEISEGQVEQLESLFNEKIEKFDGNEKMAWTAAASEFNFSQNAGPKDVRVLAIGVDGLPDSFADSQAMVLFGVAIPEGDNEAGKIAIVVEENDLNGQTLDDVVDLFTEEIFRPVDAKIDYWSNSLKVPNAYRGEVVEEMNSSDGDGDHYFTRVDEPDMDFETRKNVVENHTELLEIKESPSNLSLKDEGYLADFGLDIKRVDGAAIVMSDVSATGARYIMQDDSFLDAGDLPQQVRSGEGDNIGLLGWAQPEAMHIASGGHASVYGAVRTTDDGDVRMDIYGYEPIFDCEEVPIPEETESSGGSGTSADGESIDEQMI